MVSWSTDTINERERFSYWREILCQSLFNVSAEAPPGRFTGRMRMRTSGPLRFLMSQSSRYRFDRVERHISSAAAGHYTVLMQLRGQTAINRGDDSFVVGHNDIAIFDGRHTFSADNSDGALRVVAVMPRAMIESRAPWLRRRPLCRLPSNLRFLDLARRHMARLVSNNLGEAESYLLAENFCNLLALSSAADVPLKRLHAELQQEALLAFCQKNLHHPGLSPGFVAAHFGISVRTLHLRFEKLGQSFGAWLLEARLDACSNALRDPLQRTCSISAVAYSCGFSDLSYFNKTFRARFGMPPSQWRMI